MKESRTVDVEDCVEARSIPQQILKLKGMEYYLKEDVNDFNLFVKQYPGISFKRDSRALYAKSG